MPRAGATTLSDLIAPTLTLACEPCGRRGNTASRGCRPNTATPG
jgi:hypothetical protein